MNRALAHSPSLHMVQYTYPDPVYPWLKQKPDLCEVMGWPVPDWVDGDAVEDFWSNLNGRGETPTQALNTALVAAGLMEVSDGAE